ncbi:hypothetical protein RM553_09525 [Zunongwangia sp. F363]|uniref:Uncharacterized protein n=1 Tax=Autumnicola tepida TaxID=3075595 RepID=A0ABU3C9S5_9FLAO|nr:hypothetical protein [Zunongwangia sp. F363]MDT0643066.1 hypothetical protein [Zunongwangia sp. F363]
MKKILKDLGKHILWSSLIVLGGLFLYMIIVQIIGYLPYSDRPGPGWQNDGNILSWQGISMIGGFISFLGIYILVSLLIIFGLFRIFRLFGYNRIVFSTLGGLAIGLISFYWTMGIGWYIAIDFSTIIAGGILGLIYGAFLFPRFLKT